MSRFAALLSPFRVFAIGLACCLLCCQVAPSEEPPPGTSAPAPAAPPEVTAEESASFAKVSAIFERVPKRPRDEKRPLKDVQMDVDSCLVHCNSYRAHFPEGAYRAEVGWMTSRLLAINYQRRESCAVEIWRIADLARYCDTILGIVDAARSLTTDATLQLKLDKVKGHVFYLAGRYEEGAAHYEQILKNFPDDPESDESVLARLTCLQGLARLDKVQAEAAGFIERFPRSEFIMHAIALNAKALYQLGHLHESLAVWEKHAALLRSASRGEAITIAGESHKYASVSLNDFQSVDDERLFQIPNLKYVIGDVEGAKAAYQNSIDEFTRKEQEKTLSQVGRVYLGPSQRTLKWINDHQGKPVAALDLREGWVTEHSFDLAAERGNVIALYFATSGNQRYHDFARFLQERTEDFGQHGFRCAWIAHAKGMSKIKEQAKEFRAEISALGISFPAGIDHQDDRNWLAYRAFDCPVGGGTIVVLDRQGQGAWFKVDPTFRDVEAARQLFLRLERQPAK